MVEPTPFIRPATVEKIKFLKRRGSATTQALQDPMATVTFESRDPANGHKYKPIAQVDLIRIRLSDREPNSPVSVGGEATETRIAGSAKAWATDVATVQAEDRFKWDGQWCSITSVEPERYGYREIRFLMLPSKKAVL